MPIVSSSFLDVPFEQDTCSRWRHFFARLGLVKHRTRTVTMEQLQVELNQIMNNRIEVLSIIEERRPK